MTSCPFCGVAAPEVAPKLSPVTCVVCKRHYAARLEACPFCARDAAGGTARASAAAPSDAASAVDAEHGERAPLVLGNAIAAAAYVGMLLLAWWASRHWVTSPERFFRYASLAGAPLGYGVLRVVSRETALELARIGILSRYALQPTGWHARTAFPFFAWAVASLPCACLFYVLALAFNAALAAPPQRLSCRASSEPDGNGALSFGCGATIRGHLPAGAVGAVRPNGSGFAIDASLGALGVWIFDPGSIDVAAGGSSGWHGGPDAEPGPTLLPPGGLAPGTARREPSGGRLE